MRDPDDIDLTGRTVTIRGCRGAHLVTGRVIRSGLERWIVLGLELPRGDLTPIDVQPPAPVIDLDAAREARRADAASRARHPAGKGRNDFRPPTDGPEPA